MAKIIEQAIDILSGLDMYSVGAILEMAEVKVTNHPDNPTARIIRKKDKFFIEIDQHWQSSPPNHVAAVLLHELMHHSFAHLKKPSLPNAGLQNLAQDALINSVIYHMSPELGEFFKDFYAPDDMGQAFLRSDSRPPTVEATRAWRALYRGEIEEKELYHYLESLNVDPGQIPQMGGGEQIDEDDEDEDGENAEGDIGGKNPQKKHNTAEEMMDLLTKEIKEGPWQEPVSLQQKKPKKDPSEILKEALGAEFEKQLAKEIEEELRQEVRQQVWQPNDISRSDMIKVMAGIDPLLWKAPKPSTAEKSIALYVDVSRSTRRHVQKLYGICMHFIDLLDHKIFCFASDIQMVNISNLKDGLPLGKGSDIDKVLLHMMKNPADRILLMTDGDVVPSQELVDEFLRQKKQLFLILTPRGSEKSLKPLCKRVWKM